jgi:hypothetical protein
MEDLIPLLIIILISIVGALGRKKKEERLTQANPISPPAQARERDDIFSWLGKSH